MYAAETVTSLKEGIPMETRRAFMKNAALAGIAGIAAS